MFLTMQSSRAAERKFEAYHLKWSFLSRSLPANVESEN